MRSGVLPSDVCRCRQDVFGLTVRFSETKRRCLRESAGKKSGAQECGFAFGGHETSPLRDPWWGRLHFPIKKTTDFALIGADFCAFLANGAHLHRTENV